MSSAICREDALPYWDWLMYHNRDDVLHAEWSHSFHLLVGVIDDHEVRFERYKSLHGFKVFLLVSSFPNRTNKTRSIIRSTVLVTRFMSTFPKKIQKLYGREVVSKHATMALCIRTRNRSQWTTPLDFISNIACVSWH